MTDPLAGIREALADRYAIEHELGAGGMATVYLASDLTNRRNVAIKVMKSNLADRAGIDRFQREIEIVANLAHPNILPLHDSGRSGDLCWFVSPYIEGESLAERIEREGPFPLDEALRIATEVADALAYAHERGLVHRDIKPRNIMMEAGHAVVADFGIALQLDAAPADRLTTPGVSPGTPHYMSPEQLTGERRIDGRSDIYSLGCVLYEMITGDPPFPGSTVEVIRARKLAGLLPDLHIVRPAASGQLERLTLRCLAVSAADRFRTAADLVDALKGATNELVRSTTGPAQHDPASEDRSAGSRLRKRAVAVAIGALTVAVFATLIGFLSTLAFDVKLQVPADYRPSRSDFTVIGLRSLLPYVLIGSTAIVAWILIRLTLRMFAGAAGKVMPGVTARVRSAGSTIAPRWRGFWSAARPVTASDAYFAVSLVASVLLIRRFWPIIAALFTAETGILACGQRPFHRSFAVSLEWLITGIIFGWFAVFRWLQRRGGDDRGVAVAKWGSVLLVVFLFMVLTVPWRLLWEQSIPRVLVNQERAYVIKASDTDRLLYLPERGITAAYPRDGSAVITEKGLPGYIFEERSAFDSNRRNCLSITDPE